MFLNHALAPLASILLAVELMLFVVVIHVPGAGSDDEQTKTQHVVQIFKDVALAGAALYIAGTLAV